MKKVATGIATGGSADASLATTAVNHALEKARLSSASAVLLFLTSEYAKDPSSAIKAAARAAGCTQVIGCSATGIFTEEEWVLDGAAAAAMVFGQSISLNTIAGQHSAGPLMTLAAPSAMNSTWLADSASRYGGVSGDATGYGPFSVWQNGKGATQGYCEVSFKTLQTAVAASHGLKLISAPAKISLAEDYDVLTIDTVSALGHLTSAWLNQDNAAYSSTEIPFHQLVAVYADSEQAIVDGQYHVATIIHPQDEHGAVTLSKQLHTTQWISWAVRDANKAQIDIVKTATQLGQQLNQDPIFGLLFSCLGRGPSYYDGSDQDLELIKTLFPGMPVIGFYGNGEIAPILDKNELLQYSAVLGLFAETQ